MKIFFTLFFLFIIFLFNTKIAFADIHKIYPYKKIKITDLLKKHSLLSQYHNYDADSGFASFYKNSNTIVFVAGWDILIFYDIKTGKSYSKKLNIKGYRFQYPQVSPDYKHLILEGEKLNYDDSDKGICVLYNLEKNTYDTLFKGANIVLWDSSFSNDSNYFLLRIADDLHIYNTKTKKTESIFKKVFDYYSEPSYVSCCSENNENFLIKGRDGTKIRNLKTGKKVKDIEYILPNIIITETPKFSCNGKYIMYKNLNDTKTLKKILELNKKEANCDFLYNNCTSSRDSKSVTCSFYGYGPACKFHEKIENLFLYSIENRNQIATLVMENEYLKSSDRTNIHYSPDDKYILAKGINYIIVWKIK